MKFVICTFGLLYNSWRAYGQSKLANILHANELAKRLKDDGVNIIANSLHPGAIVTNLYRHTSAINVRQALIHLSVIDLCCDFAGIVNAVGRLVMKNAQQGAATTCYVALHPQVKGVSGEYFSDSNVCKTTSQGKDADLAKKLWDFSISLIEEK
ncbi:Short-chain dehydrogenase TIC 32 [Lathyrus oleraceus]|uniref:Short-chain dehydrogenase TIC 32 n=1 Tax=Pisum sativum TaxID=3888 RepID=A0A9D4WF56_PEA|nr:Short-chain dehydrogenase TIC 32 [Pisum sativum]